MDATTEQPPEVRLDRVDRGQYVFAAVLAAVGIYTVIDARGLNVGYADPVGPRVFPYVIGTAMVVLAVLLALATARGDVAEGEEGEDVDLATPPDWVTVGKLAGVMGLNLLLVNLLGWAITGALLFAGCAWALGSRTLLRDVLVGVVLSVGSWYAFYVGLDVPLPPGVLDGIL
ncbi:tripartite tricarboxylate transporter TctB family protein [Nocardioides houyundeii]|uniref:tripartite tricarboxylate transporter TctB family protein n=1 Tax=Nocardioides houyundeii TaxID=2045452 RepID=UPI000DF36447|nr:tripartite tricarboxylate transporter TctB family protein [Nocardioides houyundeii]